MSYKFVIEAPFPLDEDSVYDAVTSLIRKRKSKPYGEWLSRLAEVVKGCVNVKKGDWQKYWTVATKIFETLYRGHSVDVARDVARGYAREMGVPPADADKLVKCISEHMEYILGGKRGGR